MTLSVYTIEKSEQWDVIVRSFQAYDVYYLSGYVKAFQLHGDGDPLLFYYENDDLRGINVVMKRDIANDPHFAGRIPPKTYFDFTTPYGYGGWLFEGNGNPSPLYAAYIDWCEKNQIISEFVRFSLYSNSRNSYYGEVIPRTQNVVRNLDHPIDDMLMDFEHKVRKNIKRANESGLQLIVDSDGNRLNDFLSIYYSTMDRNNAEDSYYFNEAFFRQINTLIGNHVYFYALLDDVVISTELVIMGSDIMYSYLGGTNSDYYSVRPNDFLKYQIIHWGLKSGYKRFVLGGGYGADDGIFRYKKSFAPNGIVRFYTGQTVFFPEVYENLNTMRTNLPESEFFPRYRA